jgi:hypothetical protein
MTTTKLLVAQGEKGELSSRQLRDYLNDFGAIMLEAIRTAHCDHDGSRWVSHGKTYCGLCNREVADDLPKV